MLEKKIENVQQANYRNSNFENKEKIENIEKKGKSIWKEGGNTRGKNTNYEGSIWK